MVRTHIVWTCLARTLAPAPDHHGGQMLSSSMKMCAFYARLYGWASELGVRTRVRLFQVPPYPGVEADLKSGAQYS